MKTSVLLSAAAAVAMLAGCSNLPGARSSSPQASPLVQAYEQGRLQATADTCTFAVPAQMRDFHKRSADMRIASLPRHQQLAARQAFQQGLAAGGSYLSLSRVPCDSIQPALAQSSLEGIEFYRSRQRIGHLRR